MNNDCEFDIERFNVFSVERAKRLEQSEGPIWKIKNILVDLTVIGYVDNNGKIKEWYLDCSPEKHQDFVNRFRQKIKKIA